MIPLGERLITIIRQRYGTLERGAKELNYNPRQLSRWESGEVPKIIKHLEERGIIHITDDCPCSKAKTSVSTEQAQP